jgi:nucleoside-diphosphate-sugar epimerase
MYGEGDDVTKFTAYVIRAFLDNASELKLTLGEQRRDFIYIDDAVDAYAVVINHLSEFNPGFNELDVGSGRAVTIREFVEIARRIADASTDLKFGAVPYRPNEPMFLQANTAFLNALGWKNKYDLASGVALTIESERYYPSRNTIDRENL